MIERYVWPYGAMVARLTPDQKAGCSSHSGVMYIFFQLLFLQDVLDTTYPVLYFIIVTCFYRYTIIIILFTQNKYFSLEFNFICHATKYISITSRKSALLIPSDLFIDNKMISITFLAAFINSTDCFETWNWKQRLF